MKLFLHKIGHQYPPQVISCHGTVFVYMIDKTKLNYYKILVQSNCNPTLGIDLFTDSDTIFNRNALLSSQGIRECKQAESKWRS